MKTYWQPGMRCLCHESETAVGVALVWLGRGHAQGGERLGSLLLVCGGIHLAMMVGMT